MEASSLEATLRMAFEPLQYAAFVGALVVLGMLESIAALGAEDVARGKRWPANFALTAINILLLGVLPVGSLAAADVAASRDWGLLNQIAMPASIAVVAAFLLRSLVSYGIHVAMHKVPWLWRLHRVHHTDTAMDVSTAVRFHPLEFVISVPVVLAATLVLGFPPLAVIIYSLVDAAMAVFSHANLRLPDRMERGVRLVLVTPAMHRIHHSASQPETDSNYGATLSCWDRLFGTHRAKLASALASIQLGLAECRDRRPDSLLWLLSLPFLKLRPEPAGRQDGGDNRTAMER
jgi:sterol desaturase/sphingolipid hydroxylase (fatty acid hydroxylase superfamily)